MLRSLHCGSHSSMILIIERELWGLYYSFFTDLKTNVYYDNKGRLPATGAYWFSNLIRWIHRGCSNRGRQNYASPVQGRGRNTAQTTSSSTRMATK